MALVQGSSAVQGKHKQLDGAFDSFSRPYGALFSRSLEAFFMAVFKVVHGFVQLSKSLD